MARGFARGTFVPVRFYNGQMLVWCATGERERGLPIYRLKVRDHKDQVLQFPMGGNARGCVQDMSNPT